MKASSKAAIPGKRAVWIETLAGAARSVFGLIWAIDAYLKFQPGFQSGYIDILKTAASGQSPVILPWWNFWIGLVSLNPSFFAMATAVIEAVIALGLLLGLGRKWIYVLGLGFALIIWSVPEAFGGPYTTGATDVGAGLIYAMMFMALIILDSVLGRSPYSLDFYIERSMPNWSRFAEWAPQAILDQEPARLSWAAQVPILIGMVVFLLVVLGLLTIGLNAPAASSSLLPQLSQAASLHS